MKRAATVAVILVLALASTGLARKKRKGDREPSGGFGVFGPTVAFVDYTGINRVLGQYEIGELESLHWMFGGGGYAHVGRVVLGGSGWGGTQSVSSDDRLVRVNVSGGMFEAGYALISMKHLAVIPMLGIGGSGYEITAVHQDYPESFEEFLESPGSSSSISFTGFTLVPELVINIPVKFIGLQLRGGYMYAPTTPEWQFDTGPPLVRGPEVAKGHPFAGVGFLFGGWGGRNRS